MTVREALKKYRHEDNDLLLAHVLKKDKEFLYLNPTYPLTQGVVNKFKVLHKKRKSGMPAAYLLGYRDFYGLRFKVSPHVLIPRPESEWLVEQAVNHIRTVDPMHQKKWRVLDIGTGCGCLVISLAKQLAGYKLGLTGTDISSQSLRVAKTNATNHDIKVDFKKSNLFQKLQGKFDIILANLPYVPRREYARFKKILRYEPSMAITTGDDTWELFEQLLKQVRDHLYPKTILLLEIDPSQKKALERQVKELLPGASLRLEKDIHDLWRSAMIRI